MGLSLRPRTPDQLGALLEECRGQDLTYDRVGCSLVAGPAPEGLRRATWERSLDGPGWFEAGVGALHAWAVHRGAGLAVLADGPLAVGTHVAISAPLPLASVDACCRVVAVVDEPDRFGFAYGTLPIHPERGEESFVLDRVRGCFTVTAVSRPVHPLARVAPPIADRLQARATARYLDAMTEAVAGA